MIVRQEIAAGAALVRLGAVPAVLMMRVQARVFELPKGGVERGESLAEAAARELCEETGLRRAPDAGPELATIDYQFDGAIKLHKRVTTFLFMAPPGELEFAPPPRPVRELRWVEAHELASLPLKSENLRPLLRAALESAC